MKASGEFTVTLTSLDDDFVADDGIGSSRRRIEKTFQGDLDAVSRGEMLSVITAVKGSAGYVAIEQVKGKLAGRQGSFVLQHYGTLNRGAEHLKLEVVPDSATGELEGLSGFMLIILEKGQHFYEFDYQL